MYTAWPPAWLPTLVSQDRTRVPCLKTQGCPFALQGSGESLSLYRFQSCKYNFPLTPSAKERDVSSEAFITQKALLVADWQGDTQNWDAHPRAANARANRLKSSILLPVFEAGPAHSRFSHPVAVVEATSACDVACPVTIETVAEELCIRLEAAALTVLAPVRPATMPSRQERVDVARGPTAVRSVTPQIPSAAPSVQGSPAQDRRVVAPQQTHSDAATRDAFQIQIPMEEQDIGTAQSEDGTAVLPGSSTAPDEEQQADRVEEQENAEQEQQGQEVQARRLRRSTRALSSSAVNPADLSVEDVRQQFSFGLKEAATRLGISTTTLKRVCRRNGIARWPRRELLRESLEDAEATPMEPETALVEPLTEPSRPSPQPPFTSAPTAIQAPNPPSIEQPQKPPRHEASEHLGPDADDLLGPAELWAATPQMSNGNDDGLLLHDIHRGINGSLEALQSHQLQLARPLLRNGHPMLVPSPILSSPSSNSAQISGQLAQPQQLGPGHVPPHSCMGGGATESRLMSLLTEANHMMHELQGYAAALQSQRDAAPRLRPDLHYQQPDVYYHSPFSRVRQR
ncbi:hypothetical protein WJX73_008160 [Symbiochloris irregularis]|uniref:RWP-RK domain-containing protein n=1 Tax=Symbiochloris irregularis TaxID=706552 RepID=A0AAW1NFR9_9CHLO